MTGGGRSSRVALRDGACDLACVVVFVLIGRRSHHEASGVEGFVRVAWPFAVALAGASVVAVLARLRPWPAGVLAWVGTVVIGMALRLGVQGRDLRIGFVVVTTLFLALTMLGWRAVAWAVVPRVRRARGR